MVTPTRGLVAQRQTVTVVNAHMVRKKVGLKDFFIVGGTNSELSHLSGAGTAVLNISKSHCV